MKWEDQKELYLQYDKELKQIHKMMEQNKEKYEKALEAYKNGKRK